jgi:hypothetical protein
MKARLLFALTVVLATATSFADDLSPGLWEITMESRVGADTAWAPAPFNLKQCLTANDARDPSKLIGSISTPGATGCSYTERNYSGGTFRFALDCSGTFGIKSRGSVMFGATQFSGEITATGNVAGQTTEFQNKVSGTRVGDC